MQPIDLINFEENWSDAEVLPSDTNYVLKSYLSIYRNGIMKFSLGFVAAHFEELMNPTHVILSYSKNMGAIIFDFVHDDSDPGSKMLQKHSPRKGRCFWVLQVQKMFESINIDLSESRGRYNPVRGIMSDGSSKWVIYLNKPENKPEDEDEDEDEGNGNGW